MSDEGTFEFERLLNQLRLATDPGAALRLSSLLLNYVFGKKNGIGYSDYPYRVISPQGWTNAQREVLRTIADCSEAWPEVAFTLQQSLDLDFEPTQGELRNALSSNVIPSLAEPASPPSLEQADVIAAVARLASSFNGGNLKEALQLFEPFKPFSAVGVPMLVEQLNASTAQERDAAAWALGRLGPVARSAVPALFEAWQRDRKDRYAHMALADIGLDNYDSLVELMRRKDDIGYEAHWVFGAAKEVPDEVINNLLTDPNSKLRYAAVSKLRFSEAVHNVNRLLDMLDDRDESVAEQARYGLKDAGPQCVPVVINAASGGSTPKRRLVAEILADFAPSLSEHGPQLAAWLTEEPDADVRISLLLSLSCLESIPSEEVVRALSQIALHDPGVAVREQAVRTSGSLARSEELAQTVIQVADQDPNVRLRAIAIETLPRFRRPMEQLLTALERALCSSIQPICLQAVWSLYYLPRAKGVPLLLKHLPKSTDHRVTAEIAWALGATKTVTAITPLRTIEQSGEGLSKPMAGWAIEHIERSNLTQE